MIMFVLCLACLVDALLTFLCTISLNLCLLFNESQDKLTPAREEFCPSSGNLPPPPTPAPSAVPTPAPFTKAPTASTESPSLETTSKPTKKPSSKKPTSKKPSMSMGSGDIFDHFDLSGKSKKDKKKKKKKRRGMDERDFDRMKEDFRTLRRRDAVMEFGRPLQ